MISRSETRCSALPTAVRSFRSFSVRVCLRDRRTDDPVGAYAEYINVSTKMLVHKPKHLSWEEAAGVPEVSSIYIFKEGNGLRLNI